MIYKILYIPITILSYYHPMQIYIMGIMANYLISNMLAL